MNIDIKIKVFDTWKVWGVQMKPKKLLDVYSID